MASAYAIIVKQECKDSSTDEDFKIDSFTVDFIQPFLTGLCESRPISFPDGTSWTLKGNINISRQLNFSLKYHGELSVLASVAMKITSKGGGGGRVAAELNERQNIDIRTIHKYDSEQNNMITGPNIQLSYEFMAQRCLIISVDVSIHVKPYHFFHSSSHSLHQDVIELLRKEKVADLALVVMSNGDLVKIPVHKFILCARSAVFLTMFENQMQESQTNEIVITDATADIVNEFVNYLYSDTCQITADTVVSLLQMAHKYAVRGLVEMCEANLLKGLAVQNVVDLLVLSDTYDLKALKRAGIVLFAQNYAQVRALREVDLNAGALSAKLLCEIIGHVVSR